MNDLKTNKVDNILKICRFIEEYGQDFTREQNYFLQYGLEKEMDYDLANEVYAFLNITREEENPYLAYFHHLQNRFDLTQNIVEVASGEFPILAYYIDSYQRKVGKGSITIYDPKTSIAKLGNIRICRDSFAEDTPLKETHLLIGYKICEATLPFIQKSYQEHIPFSFVPCSCEHIPEEDKEKYKEIAFYRRWTAFIKDYLKSHIEPNSVAHFTHHACDGKKISTIEKVYRK